MYLGIIICALALVDLGLTTSWKINLKREPFNMTYVDSFKHDSVITCVAYCMSDSYLTTASLQDGVCYCLSDLPNSFSSQIRLTSVIEKFSGLSPTECNFSRRKIANRRSPVCRDLKAEWDLRPSECELKGYQVYVNLGICLKINATEVGWDAAYDVCQQDSGYLLNIYTDEIYSALEQFTTDHGVEKIYIGGYGVKSNGFEWSRGGQIKTEYWNAYEPDNHQGTEYCVSYFNGDTIGLYDIVCTEKQPFVCELML